MRWRRGASRGCGRLGVGRQPLVGGCPFRVLGAGARCRPTRARRWLFHVKRRGADGRQVDGSWRRCAAEAGEGAAPRRSARRGCQHGNVAAREGRGCVLHVKRPTEVCVVRNGSPRVGRRAPAPSGLAEYGAGSASSWGIGSRRRAVEDERGRAVRVPSDGSLGPERRRLVDLRMPGLDRVDAGVGGRHEHVRRDRDRWMFHVQHAPTASCMRP
jgi:hypothetical protein